MAGRRLMLLLVTAAVAVFMAAAPAGGSKSVRFDLLHRKPASLAEQARMDRARAASISARRRRRAAETKTKTKTTAKAKAAPAAEAFAMPLSSGAYTGTGQYFVRFRVGTPAQTFLLVADTGSDLTWVKCRRPAPAHGAANGSSHSSASPHGRVFRPDKSRTWASIPCSSDTCTASLPFSLAACPTPGSPCAYDYRLRSKHNKLAISKSPTGQNRRQQRGMEATGAATPPAPHPAVEPLAFLLGKWRGEGEGSFPTISSFRYGEELLFSHHPSKPMISYTQRTWKAASGEPMHAESGYWRPRPDGSVEVVIAQSTGLAEVQKGSYDAEKKTVTLQSELVGNASKVKQITRAFQVVHGELSYVVQMATITTSLQPHLKALLKKI